MSLTVRLLKKKIYSKEKQRNADVKYVIQSVSQIFINEASWLFLDRF
jgi:hypothetical protein